MRLHARLFKAGCTNFRYPANERLKLPHLPNQTEHLRNAAMFQAHGAEKAFFGTGYSAHAARHYPAQYG